LVHAITKLSLAILNIRPVPLTTVAAKMAIRTCRNLLELSESTSGVRQPASGLVMGKQLGYKGSAERFQTSCLCSI